MSSTRKASAPTNRVYKSVTPLSQAKFTEPKKRIISYGKKSTVRCPKQETLTQMDFVHMQQKRDNASDEGVGLLQDENDRDQSRRKRRRTAGDVQLLEDYDKENYRGFDNDIKKTKTKRRKTAGDTSDLHPDENIYHINEERPKKSAGYTARKRRNAIPLEASESQQTITQVVRSFSALDSTAERPLSLIEDLSMEGNDDADVLHSAPRSSQLFQKKMSSCGLDEQTEPHALSDILSPIVPLPQTPRRFLDGEIPSSQSPATPLSLHSLPSSLNRSPSSAKSVNSPIQYSQRRAPTSLEIENTIDTTTETSQVSITPTKRSSPPKSVRFAIPADSGERCATSPAKEAESKNLSQKSAPSCRTLDRKSKFEIMDSDADSDEDETDRADKDNDGSVAEVIRITEDYGTQIIQHEQGEGTESEPYFSDIGEDTQLEAERILDFAASCTTKEQIEVREPVALFTQKRTQYHESQRLSTQNFNSMAPRTPGSDIFITLHPHQMKQILDRIKDQITRSYALPEDVRRTWIYETAPVCALKYMAAIGPATSSCQITDERLVGNSNVDARKGGSWQAYGILELYELAEPISLADLRAKEWLLQAPKTFKFVPPAVLGELMANLKPPIFAQNSETPSSSLNDTQGAEEQLMSTIRQFTQAPPSSQLPLSQFRTADNSTYDDAISSSQREAPRTIFGYSRSSQASTVDYSQSQTLRTSSVADVVLESPTQPVPSSPSHTLPSTRSNNKDSDHSESGSVRPFSIASSQILTKSQMLPDSLLDDVVPGPPLFIQDSDDEDLDD